MTQQDPMVEAIDRLSRATQRISKSVSPDDSTLAEAVHSGSTRLAHSIQAPTLSGGDGTGPTLTEGILMAFGHGGVGGNSSTGIVGGLFAIASALDRLAEAVESRS